MSFDQEIQDLWQGRPDAKMNEYIYQMVDVTKLNQLPESNEGFAIIGFASDEGIRRNFGRIGAKEGPNQLRKALATIAANKKIALYDLGNIECIDNNLEKAQAELALTVKEVIGKGLMPIVLGGGHETAWGHFLGLDQAYQSQQNIAIVNFDAHLDLRAVNSDQKGSSGTPFYQISEYLKAKNRPFDYYCFGVQSLANSKSLFDYAKAQKVMLYKADAINKHPDDLTLIEAVINKHPKIYVSLCLDVFQVAIAPGVSAPQALGISSGYVLDALKLLKRSNQVIGFDIVELSPPFDCDNRTAKLAASLLSTFLLA